MMRKEGKITGNEGGTDTNPGGNKYDTDTNSWVDKAHRDRKGSICKGSRGAREIAAQDRLYPGAECWSRRTKR